MTFRVKKVQDPSQVDDSHGFKVGGMILQEADWIEVKWKRTDPLYQQGKPLLKGK